MEHITSIIEIEWDACKANLRLISDISQAYLRKDNSQSNLRHILRKFQEFFGISKAYLRKISFTSISDGHIKYMDIYLIHTSEISQANLRQISLISQVYLRDISGISGIYHANLNHINSCISEVYLRNISGISQVYLRYISIHYTAVLSLKT